VERPTSAEYAPFYAGYVSLVTETDVLGALEAQPAQLQRAVAGLTAERETHRYEPGKWSIREVLGHLGDGERVFGYRAFCISRGEQKPLPGFDENEYVAASGYDERPVGALVQDFSMVREANLAMLRSLSEEAWTRLGNANGTPVSLRALAFIMAGHVRHHLGVLRSKYGLGA
jgi:hypothetical protein